MGARLLAGLGRARADHVGDVLLDVGVDRSRVQGGQHGLHGVVALVTIGLVTEGTGGPGTCVRKKKKKGKHI